MTNNIEITQQEELYKYFPVNEFLFRTLINNELFFSAPSTFNDPFDCNFNIQLVENSEFEKKMLQDTFTELDIEQYSLPVLRQLFTESFSKNNHFFNSISEDTGVTCFSEKCDNFLMWSHYTNKHSGVCLIFDWRIDVNYFMGYKIKYSDELCTIIWSSNEVLLEQIFQPLLIKLKHWDYESEVRSVSSITNNDRTLAFNPKALKGIIFGVNTKKEDIDLIKRIVSLHDKYENVKYYNAELNRLKSLIQR
jgi:hypothetical protein